MTSSPAFHMKPESRLPGENINNLRNAEETTVMAENEEE